MIEAGLAAPAAPPGIGPCAGSSSDAGRVSDGVGGESLAVGLDVLAAALERLWFPGSAADPGEAARLADVQQAARCALALAAAREAMDRAAVLGRGYGPGAGSAIVEALRDCASPPWELALQRWMDAVAPGQRSWGRPSRRQGCRRDIVLPGRVHAGWTLHLVLDTSGSMTDELALALGTIAAFGRASGAESLHILQCDEALARDEVVDLDAFDAYRIDGFGGSDMGPAMLRLAEDPEVRAAVVLTDGMIAYPREPMPYELLWAVVPGGLRVFEPPYGRVVRMGLPARTTGPILAARGAHRVSQP